MPHSVEYYSDAGNQRARVVVDVDGASLDADANPIGSQWQTLKNVLTDLPGVLRKRGAITNAGANSTDVNDSSTSAALAFYDGQLVGGTYRGYVGVCNDGGTVEHYLQNEASSRTSLFTGTAIAGPVAKCPTVGGWLVVTGKQIGSAATGSFATSPSQALMYSGCAGSTLAYTTGTVTTTSGSNIVTGSGTTFTSAMVGMGFRVTTDTYNFAWYKVKAVNSATELVLERNYAGSATGAGKSYVLGGYVTLYQGAAGPFGAANTAIRAKVTAGAWGRLVVASTKEPGSAGSMANDTPEYKSRIRWSGTIDSDEGSGSATGIYAWDSGGYVDLAAKFGEVIALGVMKDSVLAFQESGLTVIHGDPVFDGAGSIDISEVHPSVAINGGFAYEVTPQGVFFFDKNVGPCVYDGTRVQRIGDKRVTRTMLPYGITAVGYYDGKVLFSGTTTAGIFVFDTATGQWSLQVPPAVVSCMIPGRVENDEDVVGLGGGTQVVNLANMFDAPGVAATDWDGSAFVVDVKTGKIGDTLTMLRPERAWITYRLTDLSTTNPYLSTTTTTGLPDTSDTAHTHTSAITELVETTDVETRELVLNLDRDPMVQVRALQANAAGKLELYALVLDCAVEGVGASS